jgi:hypothetical protein
MPGGDSSRAGFFAGASAGAAAALAGMLAWQAYTRRTQASAAQRRPWTPGSENSALKPAAPRASSPAAAADGPASHRHDQPALTSASLRNDPIIREQLTRNIQFFGLGGQGAVCDALVVVVGLGVRDLTF